MYSTVTGSARPPHPPAGTDLCVRVGDREREDVIARLGQAFAEGYLSVPEYETRLGAAPTAPRRRRSLRPGWRPRAGGRHRPPWSSVRPGLSVGTRIRDPARPG